jgi:hypothetical protein
VWGFSPLEAQAAYVPVAQAHHHHLNLNLLSALPGDSLEIDRPSFFPVLRWRPRDLFGEL